MAKKARAEREFRSRASVNFDVPSTGNNPADIEVDVDHLESLIDDVAASPHRKMGEPLSPVAERSGSDRIPRTPSPKNSIKLDPIPQEALDQSRLNRLSHGSLGDSATRRPREVPLVSSSKQPHQQPIPRKSGSMHDDPMMDLLAEGGLDSNTGNKPLETSASGSASKAPTFSRQETKTSMASTRPNHSATGTSNLAPLSSNNTPNSTVTGERRARRASISSTVQATSGGGEAGQSFQHVFKNDKMCGLSTIRFQNDVRIRTSLN